MIFAVGCRLVKIKKLVGSKVICDAGFNNMLFRYEGKVSDWTVVRELIFIF